MKKIILIALVALFAAAPAFATQCVITTTPVALGSTSFSTSTKVTLCYAATTTAYTVASKHEQGTTVYTSSSAAATISEVMTHDNYKGDVITNESGAGVGI